MTGLGPVILAHQFLPDAGVRTRVAKNAARREGRSERRRCMGRAGAVWDARNCGRASAACGCIRSEASAACGKKRSGAVNGLADARERCAAASGDAGN
jgi:hypothetical protein